MQEYVHKTVLQPSWVNPHIQVIRSLFSGSHWQTRLNINLLMIRFVKVRSGDYEEKLTDNLVYA